MRRIRPRSVYDVLALASFFLVVGGGTALASFVVSSNSQIGPGTVSGHKPPAGKHANIINGSINSLDLSTSSVGSPQLKPAAVNQLALHSGSVTSPKIAGGAVNTAQIGLIPQARVEFTAPQGITNNTYEDLTFDVARYDNDGFFGPFHDRLVAPVTGVYAITASVAWNNGGDGVGGDRFVDICKNASCDENTALAASSHPAIAGSGFYQPRTVQPVSTVAKLNAGDFIKVSVDEVSGHDLSVAGVAATNLTMTWVGKG
jgi:hypothetical protein